jgi:Domain of unknown function (DUF4388)
MALVGDLKDLALVDIIQINCIGRNTARLTVHYPIGDGVLYFQDGDIVDAHFGELSGIDAVYQALRFTEGGFRIDTGIAAPNRTVYEPWANILMEGMRLIDEEKAGMIPTTPGLTPMSGSGALMSASSGTLPAVTRVANPYQTLVNDLSKIKGVDSAIVALRDGSLQAQINVKSPERLAALMAFLAHQGGQVGTIAKVGSLRRASLISGQRKLIIFDQEDFVASIECGSSIRFETISPHIERAFRKVQVRRSMTGPLPTTL